MQELLNRIEAFRHKHLLEETTFGIWCANDPYLIRDIAKGRKFRLRSLDRIEKFLKMKKPKPCGRLTRSNGK